MREIDADLDELIRLHGEGEREYTFQHFLDLETREIVYWIDPDYDGKNEYEIEELDASERYLYVPKEESREGWEDMSAFVDTVSDEDLRNQLRRAIDGRGAFRMFRETLYDHPEERERWFEFQEERRRERVLRWLGRHDLRLPPETLETEEAGPGERTEEGGADEAKTIRDELLELTAWFVESVREKDGVERIALLGALTSPDPDPDGIRMLVTVENDADLAPLAKFARKLSGRANQIDRGAIVHLADPEHYYLGRTCPYRICARYQRESCTALHCARRPHLYDNLQEFRLEEETVRHPPLIVHPVVRSHLESVPEDVETELLRTL